MPDIELNMEHKAARKLLTPLRKTPFHPQWFVFRGEEARLARIGETAAGLVLDIGAGKQKVRPFLSQKCRYVALDYYQTATQWYESRPNVYADGQQLPVAANCVDTVLLLDVLEHLPRPQDCLREIYRVLKPGGKLVLHVPFLYPVHDAPLDFGRWTKHGFMALAEQHHFDVVEIRTHGNPLESAALLTNLALSKTVLRWLKHRSPLAVLLFLLPFLIFSVNVWAWLVTKLGPAETFMPLSYEMLWTRQA